jgi:hypothetical protein
MRFHPRGPPNGGWLVCASWPARLVLRIRPITFPPLKNAAARKHDALRRVSDVYRNLTDFCRFGPSQGALSSYSTRRMMTALDASPHGHMSRRVDVWRDL